jgi:hypothetical protein
MPILPQNRERLLRGGRSTLLRDRLWPHAARRPGRSTVLSVSDPLPPVTTGGHRAVLLDLVSGRSYIFNGES